ncbi:MAG: Ig-like domain-containing protein [Terriglobales bacterium]
MRTFLSSVFALFLLISISPAQNNCSGMSQGINASLNGFIPFPADNLWNQNIASAPVDPNSAALINFIGETTPLHPDFGSGLYDGSNIGIPYIVVSGTPFVNITYTAYGPESDPGPMPIPANAPIEGYPNPGSGDRHVLVLDSDNCWLYELWSSYLTSGTWRAGSGAVWDLLNDEQRPYTWTSADAAGLSVFAGLARYDEVAAGHIQHALRFTLPYSQAAFTPPASHWAATSTNQYASPMGMRLRLQASYDISGFPPQSTVILTALQQYGMILADNGGDAMFITGAPNDNWDNDDLAALKTVPASAFEVVLMDPLYTSANVPKGAAPVISSFTASPSAVVSGSPVTFNWSVANSQYNIVSPQVGAIRGTSATITPTATTTYKLYSTNQYGRSTAQVTVTVDSSNLPTTTALTSSINPSISGKAVAFTATVSPQSAGAVPTGEITFQNGSAVIANEKLVNGTAKYSTAALPPGSNTITAAYTGDTNYSGSTSAPLTQVVLATTTTTIASSTNPSSYGQGVTLTATVASTIGPPPDGETVTFEQGSTILGTGTTSGGTATFSTSALAPGTKSIKAVYAGDASYAASTSTAVSQVIGKSATTITLTSSLNPSTYGQSVTFTATVSPAFGGTPTGTVAFKNGTKTLKTVTLSGGAASYTVSNLAVGSDTITATYNGSTDFTTSSAALTQTVN